MAKMLPTDERVDFSIGNFVDAFNGNTGEDVPVDSDQCYFVITQGSNILNKGKVSDDFLITFTNQYRSIRWN